MPLRDYCCWMLALLLLECTCAAQSLLFTVPLPRLPARTDDTVSLASHRYARSGITGNVILGPISPVCGPATPVACSNNFRPYQTTITVLSASGAMLGDVRTDSVGRFRVRLYPGYYTLVPWVRGTLPSARPIRVAVKPRQFTHLTIGYDSGIR